MIMKSKAQASLEYLMTYGWALVIIATVVGVMIFVIVPPTEISSFTSSDPTKFMVKGSSTSGGTAGLVLQNITGGRIEISSITFSGDVGDSLVGYTLNRQTINPTIDFPLEIIGGQEILLENLSVANNSKNSSIYIAYTDAAGLDKDVTINSGNGGNAKGLVAEYNFVEGSGLQTADNSGNKNHGTLKPDLATGPTWQTGCKTGNCLSFDGSNDYIDIVNITDDIATGNFSVSLWFKPTATFDSGASSNQTPFRVGDMVSTNDIIIFLIASNGKIQFWHYTGGVWSIASTSQNSWTGGTWYHVVIVLGEGIYINGVKDGTNTDTTRGAIVSAGSEIARDFYVGDYFNGQLDDIKVYNRALTAGEVAAEYSRGN